MLLYLSTSQYVLCCNENRDVLWFTIPDGTLGKSLPCGSTHIDLDFEVQRSSVQPTIAVSERVKFKCDHHHKFILHFTQLFSSGFWRGKLNDERALAGPVYAPTWNDIQSAPSPFLTVTTTGQVQPTPDKSGCGCQCDILNVTLFGMWVSNSKGMIVCGNNLSLPVVVQVTVLQLELELGGRASESQAEQAWLSLRLNSCNASDCFIWNPTHLDRIWQTGTYVSEPCTDMYVHIYTSSWFHEHVWTLNIHVHPLTHLYVHSTYTCMNWYICMYIVHTCV